MVNLFSHGKAFQIGKALLGMLFLLIWIHNVDVVKWLFSVLCKTFLIFVGT